MYRNLDWTGFSTILLPISSVCADVIFETPMGNMQAAKKLKAVSFRDMPLAEESLILLILNAREIPRGVYPDTGGARNDKKLLPQPEYGLPSHENCQLEFPASGE